MTYSFDGGVMPERKNKVLASISVLIATLVLLMGVIINPVSAVSNEVNVIDAAATDGWFKYTRGDGKVDIASTYGAPAGYGGESLVFETPLVSNDKAYVATAASFNLSDLDEMTYYTYRSTNSTAPAGQVPALNIFISGVSTDTGNATLIYEPIYEETGDAGIVPGVWQEWSAAEDNSRWWSTSSFTGMACAFDCFVNLSEIKAANPDAQVTGFAINQGGGNPGLFSGADGLVVNGTSYNFELGDTRPVNATSKDECKNGNWKDGFQTSYKNQGHCVSSVVSNKPTN